jgi:hypothetical protein
VLGHKLAGTFRHLTWAANQIGIPTLEVLIGIKVLVHQLYGFERSADACPAPTRLAVWGAIQHEDITAAFPGLAERTVATGRSRMDSFVGRPRRESNRILQELGLPSSAHRECFILVISTVVSSNNAIIVPPDQFRELLGALVGVAREHGRTRIIVKPWLGDDLDLVRDLCVEQGGLVHYLDPRLPFHNVDVIGLARVMVGEPTSMLAEGAAMGCTPILFETPATRYYYGVAAHERLADFAIRADSPRAVADAVRRVLGQAPQPTQAQAAALERVVGPLDGRSTARLSAEFLRLARAPGASTAGQTSPGI